MKNTSESMTTGKAVLDNRLRFDRNELAGAFGDIGTDIPLIVGVIMTTHMDGASVLSIFGIMQIFTALLYRMPMPVQPLKAMAAIVIAQRLNASVLCGAGLAIGVIMLIFSLTGLIDYIAKLVPKCVVRGVQLGLGLQLMTLSLVKYVPNDGLAGAILAALAFAVTIVLFGNRRIPAGIIVVVLGLLYALLFKHIPASGTRVLLHVPHFQVPQWHDVWLGFLVLALPQLPLSIGNSLLATNQLARDLYPGRPVTIKKLGLTYSIMNLVSPFFGGIPTCHGSGGMAGHYAFGGRTGGSVIIYGAFLLMCGLFFGYSFEMIISVFPLSVLGAMLAVEGMMLILLIRDTVVIPREFAVAVLVGLVALFVPYGYVVGIVVGTLCYYVPNRIGERFRKETSVKGKCEVS